MNWNAKGQLYRYGSGLFTELDFAGVGLSPPDKQALRDVNAVDFVGAYCNTPLQSRKQITLATSVYFFAQNT